MFLHYLSTVISSLWLASPAPPAVMDRSHQSTSVSSSAPTVRLHHIPKHLLPSLSHSTARGGCSRDSRWWEPQKEFMTTVKMFDYSLFSVVKLKKKKPKTSWGFPKVAVLLCNPRGCYGFSAENHNHIVCVTCTNPNLVATCRTGPFKLCTEKIISQIPQSTSTNS